MSYEPGGHVAEEAVEGRSALRLRLEPGDFFARDDPRWQQEALELQDALRRELPDALPLRPDWGQKGVVTGLEVNVDTSGIFNGVVEGYKAYLGSKPREVTIAYETSDGRSGKVTISATNIDSNDLTTLAAQVLPSGG
jgi:hypothetical protein